MAGTTFHRPPSLQWKFIPRTASTPACLAHDKILLMLLRGTSSSHICLQCQLRLSDGVQRAAPALRRGRRTARLLHDDATTRDTTKARENESSAGRGGHEGREGGRPDFRIKKHFAPNSTSKSKSKSKFESRTPGAQAKALDMIYGAPQSRLRERFEPLDAMAMGKPAEVIVLRDTNIRYVLTAKDRSVIEEEEPEPVDILERLDQERGLVGQEEVEANIESCRPGPAGSVCEWGEFREAEKKLATGFTMAQLVSYVQNHEMKRLQQVRMDMVVKDERKGKKEKEGLKVKETRETNKVIIKASEWMPGVSEEGEEFEESSVRGYGSEAYTQKQKLALQLMRLCWHVSAREVEESTGEMELKLSEQNLGLLIEHSEYSDSPLKRISQQLISNDYEKIEAYKSRGVIRITAGRKQAARISNAIADALKNISVVEVDLYPFMQLMPGPLPVIKRKFPGEYGDPVIAELCRLTKTEAIWIADTKLEFHSINRRPDTKLSTPSDFARRLLLSASDSANTQLVNHAVKIIDSDIVAAPYYAKGSMSWRHRLYDWARWITPTANAKGEAETSEENTSEEQPESETVQRPLIGPTKKGRTIAQAEKYQRVLDRMKEKQPWKSITNTSTSLILGHVVHLVNKPSVKELNKFQKVEGPVKSLKAKFVPATVNLSRLVGKMENLDHYHHPVQKLYLKFLPSPWTPAGAAALKWYPPLEMQFNVDSSTKEHTLNHLHAITSDSCNDILIPDRSHDMRFQQTNTVALNRDFLSTMPEIQKFLADSELGLVQNRIVAAPILQMPLPEHLVNLPRTKKHDAKTPIQYFFAGLEYRTSLSLAFNGWRMRYTTIESGRANGRRSELTLHPVRVTSGGRPLGITPEPDEEELADQNASFVQSSYELVEALESANLGYSQNREVETEFVMPVVRGFWMGPKGDLASTRYFNRRIDLKAEEETDEAEVVSEEADWENAEGVVMSEKAMEEEK